MQDPQHRSVALALIENAIAQLDEHIRKTADQSAVELRNQYRDIRKTALYVQEFGAR